MEVTIQKKEGFIVAGVNERVSDNSLCPKVWERLFSEHSPEEMESLGKGISVGVCYDMEDDDSINYMAGYIVTDKEKAEKMGLDILEIKEAEYAVLKLTARVPECIHEGWKYAMEVFFPEHGYVHSGSPDLEYYYEGDMDSKDYNMELWIPVVKA